jgi:hypothetical protein
MRRALGSHTSTLRLRSKLPCSLKLQEWVAGYYQRDDAWSYQAHREVFDAFAGTKVEHRDAGAYAAKEQIPEDGRTSALGRQRGMR